jgi:hypothetical protein
MNLADFPVFGDKKSAAYSSMQRQDSQEEKEAQFTL